MTLVTLWENSQALPTIILPLLNLNRVTLMVPQFTLILTQYTLTLQAV